MKVGFFGELSPGWVMLAGDQSAHYLQLTGWFGPQVPLAPWVALLFGPSVSAIVPFDSGESSWLAGFRIGMSVYL